MEKQLIVGVDPGTTVGIAFLDVDGNILKVNSTRNQSLDGIITEIASVGQAVVLATDKGDTPPALTKLSGILGTRLFVPNGDISVEKKRELAGKWHTKNDHERDALAAAVYAYYHFQNKIRRVEKQVDEELERVKARVLKGEKVSDIFSPKAEAGNDEQLKAQITALRKRIRELERELDLAKKKQASSPRNILKEAAKEAKGLMIDVSKGKYCILRDVPSLSYSELKTIPIKKGDFILCRSKLNDNNGLRFLESKRVGAIISSQKIESLAPTCDIDDLEIFSWEGLFFADPLEVEKACGRRKEVAARELHDMLIDYKKGRR